MDSSKKNRSFSVCLRIKSEKSGVKSVKDGVKSVKELCITKSPVASLPRNLPKAARILGINNNTRGHILKCTESNKSPMHVASTSAKPQTRIVKVKTARPLSSPTNSAFSKVVKSNYKYILVTYLHAYYSQWQIQKFRKGWPVPKRGGGGAPRNSKENHRVWVPNFIVLLH
jgi:hypothetical protein